MYIDVFRNNTIDPKVSLAFSHVVAMAGPRGQSSESNCHGTSTSGRRIHSCKTAASNVEVWTRPVLRLLAPQRTDKRHKQWCKPG